MTINDIWGGLLCLSAGLGVWTLAKTHRRKNENKAATWLMATCGASALWTLFTLPIQFMSDYWPAMRLSSPRFACIMATGWLSLFFVLRALWNYSPSKKVMAAVGGLVLLNLVVVVINPGDIFYAYSGDFVFVNGFRGIDAQLGPWFWVHSVMSYTPILIGMVVLIWQTVALPDEHKGMAGLLLISVALLITTSLLAIFRILRYPIDLTPFINNVTCLLFYHSLFNTRAMDIMAASREAYFENSESMLFVLDHEERIVDYNKRAAALLKELEIKSPMRKLIDEVLEEWKAKRQGRHHTVNKRVMTVYTGDVEEHYYFQRSDFLRGASKNMGSYLEIQNITPVMFTLRTLQDYAFFDSLTGLPNRNFFVEKMIRNGYAGELPLCIWVGDVNLLKKINDTYGHNKGDELLQQMANILRRNATEDTVIIRMGGDEFVGLYPGAGAEEAEDYLRRVEECCRRDLSGEMEGVTIAMGYQIMHSRDEDIMALLDAADIEMYRQKQYDRRRRGDRPE